MQVGMENKINEKKKLKIFFKLPGPLVPIPVH